LAAAAISYSVPVPQVDLPLVAASKLPQPSSEE
jgi:hypothetical protein